MFLTQLASLASLASLGLVSGGGLIPPDIHEEMSMIEYVMGPKTVAQISMTQQLARKMDRHRLEGLAKDSRGMVLVLPTDLAWQKKPEWFAKLLKDESAKLRNDVIFAAGGEMDKAGGFRDLVDYTKRNGGVVDTAYGTPVVIQEVEQSICLAEYDARFNIGAKACTKLLLPARVFTDGSLYLTDAIILPDELVAELNA